MVKMRSLFTLMLLGFVTAASATVINFSYSGVPNCDPNSCTDELTGSFAFADTPLSVDVADLTAFSFTDTLSYTNLPATFTVTRSLADLQSFTATLDEEQNLLTLSFKSDDINDQIGGVELTYTAAAGAQVVHCSVIEGKDGPIEGCGLLSTGPLVTSNSVPEPSIIPLLVIGLGIAGFGFGGIGYERMKGRRGARSLI